jgi:hypothetical protein
MNSSEFPPGSGKSARPWRKAIPENPFVPPTVSDLTAEEIDAKVRELVSAHQKEAIRHAEKVNSDIDLELFAGVPEATLAEFQLAADFAARFLETEAKEDTFKTHQDRTTFRIENKTLFGTHFVKVFEANRFRLAACTGLLSRFLRIKEIVDPESASVYARLGRSKLSHGIDIPRREELKEVCNQVMAKVGRPEYLTADKYDAMTVAQRLEIVDAISDAARSYLRIVTNGALEKREAA